MTLMAAFRCEATDQENGGAGGRAPPGGLRGATESPLALRLR